MISHSSNKLIGTLDEVQASSVNILIIAHICASWVLIAKYKLKVVPNQQINVELANASRARPRIMSIHIQNFTKGNSILLEI